MEQPLSAINVTLAPIMQFPLHDLICIFLAILMFIAVFNITDDHATIRVTNLSEDTREDDLQELFRPFGGISRIYLAKDKNTGASKVC